ncbi:hypothetical protein BHC57_03670 [Snodgrassella alvi]|uniref:Uncharacterized protein n=1 Tax=Snodgrassella alvi TaxID=1196083 RepID=A0A855G961_9NEIS|nr:hypothetical protein BHC57_03670 [Snodgrassella alvi]
MLFWANHDFARISNLDMSCLRQHAQQQAFSHDNIFHSVFDFDTSCWMAILAVMPTVDTHIWVNPDFVSANCCNHFWVAGISKA